MEQKCFFVSFWIFRVNCEGNCISYHMLCHGHAFECSSLSATASPEVLRTRIFEVRECDLTSLNSYARKDVGWLGDLQLCFIHAEDVCVKFSLSWISDLWDGKISHIHFRVLYPAKAQPDHIMIIKEPVSISLHLRVATYSSWWWWLIKGRPQVLTPTLTLATQTQPFANLQNDLRYCPYGLFHPQVCARKWRDEERFLDLLCYRLCCLHMNLLSPYDPVIITLKSVSLLCGQESMAM